MSACCSRHLPHLLHFLLLPLVDTGAAMNRLHFTQGLRCPSAHARACGHNADGTAKSVPMSLFSDAAKNCQLSSCWAGVMQCGGAGGGQASVSAAASRCGEEKSART